MRTSPLSSDMTFPVNHKGDKGARLSKACPRLTKEDYWPHPERAEACFIIKPWKRYFLHRWKAVWQYPGNFLVNEQVFLWILAWNGSRRHGTWAAPFCAWEGEKGLECLLQQDLCSPCLPFWRGKSRSSSLRCLVSTIPAQGCRRCWASTHQQSNWQCRWAAEPRAPSSCCLHQTATRISSARGWNVIKLEQVKWLRSWERLFSRKSLCPRLCWLRDGSCVWLDGLNCTMSVVDTDVS